MTKQNPTIPPQVCLVTGGGGFLGSALVHQLQSAGHTVRTFSRRPAKHLAVEQLQGDLADPVSLGRAVQGCDVVFHVAAKAGFWGRYEDYFQVNTQGTLNVIRACRLAGVPKLIYTSTPSVVHGGSSLAGIDERQPYPTHYETHYPQTKAQAERAVLEANSPELATIALRPHLIWGPGDPHLIPRIVAKARTGRLKRIGTEPIRVDVTYIENAAEAHLAALAHLTPGAACAGRAYFITNDEPVELWEFLNQVLAIYQVPPVTKIIAPWKARLAGWLCEQLWRVLPGEPPMTRFVASQLSTSHWYDISAAKRDLGYQPRVSIQQGLALLKESLAANLTDKLTT